MTKYHWSMSTNANKYKRQQTENNKNNNDKLYSHASLYYFNIYYTTFKPIVLHLHPLYYIYVHVRLGIISNFIVSPAPLTYLYIHWFW